MKCVCDCPNSTITGFIGTFCEIDIEGPRATVESIDIAIISERGGCIMGLFDEKPDFSDNSGSLSEFYRESTFSDPVNILAGEYDNLLDLCFRPAETISPFRCFWSSGKNDTDDDSADRRLLAGHQNITIVSDPYGMYDFLYFARDAAGNTGTTLLGVEVY